METHYQQQLNMLKEYLLKMAGLAERAIHNGVEALLQRDTSLAEKTIVADQAINQMEILIDEECLKLLALHQPRAADLRFITSAMRINTELEGIGDQAVNIAEGAVSLNREPQLKRYIDIPRIAGVTQSMVKDVLDAFVNGDAKLARSVCERDDQVDFINEQVFQELLNYMMADSRIISPSVHLIIVSRCLERVADHATNIAEGVIFMAQAKVIKHHADESPGEKEEKD